jgi:peptidoglycan/LPS O-acetylase OafA/YrhL
VGAIRLFLALAVLYSHIFTHFLAPAGLSVFGSELVLGMNGGYAVMFFFVVSGFLISFVLETKYDHSSGTAEFYRARALRIYPLWWALYLIVPFFTWGGLFTWTGLWNFIAYHHFYDLLSGFFLFGSDLLLSFWTYPVSYTAPMPHGLELGWTLAPELTFYLIAPFVLRSKFLPPLILISSILLRIVLNALVSPGTWAAWCYYFFPSTVLFFMLGHLARVFYRKFKLPDWGAWLVLACATVSLLIQNGRYGFENLYFYMAILLFALSLPAIFEATKDNRVCNFLGDLTYPLYLSHGVLIALMETPGTVMYGVNQRILAFDPGWAAGNAQVVVKALGIILSMSGMAFLLAAGVHFFIERPAIRCTRAALSLFDRKRPIVAIAPAE